MRLTLLALLLASLVGCKTTSGSGDGPAPSDDPTEETYTSGDEDPPGEGYEDEPI
ncbi:MAG: hypothetical protein AAF447_04035 [Myxococcota bacterium]